MRKEKDDLVMGYFLEASDEELLSWLLPEDTVQEIAAEYGTCGHLRQWLVNMQPKEMAAIRGILLNTKHRVLSSSHVATGILDGALVAPREVFTRAIKQAAAAVVLVHNHPSGDTTPSPEDKLLTARMVEAGKILGINVVDHIIVGHLGYSSAKEDGWL